MKPQEIKVAMEITMGIRRTKREPIAAFPLVLVCFKGSVCSNMETLQELGAKVPYDRLRDSALLMYRYLGRNFPELCSLFFQLLFNLECSSVLTCLQ